MRNLTIERKKGFAGSMAAMKVYIEVSENPDLTINDVPCRKLGELKNGTKATFLIGNESAKVFVIAGAMSKNYCNDFVQLPEGETDLFYSGKNEMNPASGNAFRFDNNDNPEAKNNRKKGSRKGLLILLLSILIGTVVGILITKFAFKASPKTFTVGEMSITLNTDFTEEKDPDFDAFYDSKHVAVFVNTLAKPEGLTPATLLDYANDQVQNMGYGEAKMIDGEVAVVYESTNKTTYQHTVYLYLRNNKLWMVQFATRLSEASEYSDDIAKWRDSIVFQP
ncbi:MAG: hypothetical protein E7467_01675 [Ruminococcaceae bacterium]|nr:hypothetical protein [Oscillospiraceae bacterium]